MANKTFNTRVKNKRDTAANWEAVATTFQPLDGELIIVDTSAGKTRFKVGRYDTAKGRLLYYNEIPFADEYLYNDLNESQGKIYDKLKGIDDKSIIEMTLEPSTGTAAVKQYNIGIWQFPKTGFYKIKLSQLGTNITFLRLYARKTKDDGTLPEDDFSNDNLVLTSGAGGDGQLEYIYILADYLDIDSLTAYKIQFLNPILKQGITWVNTYDKTTQKWSFASAANVNAKNVSSNLTLTKGDTKTVYDGSVAREILIPTKTSELTNDSNFTTQTDLDNLTNTVVSYNAQENITDEQKAQARTNIGAISEAELAQPDWNQNDTTAKDYIKNRICYEEETVTELGNTAEVWHNLTNGLSSTPISYRMNGKVYKDLTATNGGGSDRIVYNGSVPEAYLVVVNYSSDVSQIRLNYPSNVTDFQFVKIENTVKQIDPKFILTANPDWNQNDETAKDYIKNRICYEKTSQQNIAGLKIYNVNYKGGANPDLPFQLGQIWNADYGTGSTDNLEVKQSDNGMLYIGTLTVNDTPFYIGTTSSGYNSSWVSAMHPNRTMVLTGVSGTYSTSEIVQIPSKYIPKDSLVINAYNYNGTSFDTLDKTFEDITNALADNKMVFVKSDNAYIFTLVNYLPNTVYIFSCVDLTNAQPNNSQNITFRRMYVFNDNTNKIYYSTLLDINQNITTVTNGDVKLYANSNTTGEKGYLALSSTSDPNSTSKIYPESYTINFNSKKSNTQPKVVFSGTKDNDLSGMSVDVNLTTASSGTNTYAGNLKIFNTLGSIELSAKSPDGNPYAIRVKSKIQMSEEVSVPEPTSNSNPATKKYVDDKTVVDTALSDTSTNPVQNKVITTEIQTINNKLGGLTGAMHFIGKATVDITDGSTTDPQIANYTTKEKGDVILGKDDHKEFVWNGATWEKLGDEGSYALKTTTINGKALSDNITLTASDVGAASASTIETMQAAIDSKPSPADAVYTATAASTDGVAYTATVSGIDSLTVGASFIMIPNKASTSKAPTLNVNGLGAKPIRRRLSSLTTSLQQGYSTNWIALNKPFTVVYDGTAWVIEGLTKTDGADVYGAVAQATADAKGNNIADTYATIAMLQSLLPKVTTITLTSNWVGDASPYYQDIALSCVTETSIVDLQPTPEQLNSWQDDGIAFTTLSGNGTVRVYVAGGKPSSAISVQIRVQEVTVI